MKGEKNALLELLEKIAKSVTQIQSQQFWKFHQKAITPLMFFVFKLLCFLYRSQVLFWIASKFRVALKLNLKCQGFQLHIGLLKFYRFLQCWARLSIRYCFHLRKYSSKVLKRLYILKRLRSLHFSLRFCILISRFKKDVILFFE